MSDQVEQIRNLLTEDQLQVDAGSENGLVKLVLALVNVVHQLLESQTLRRAEAGTLDEEELAQIGDVLMAQARQINQLCQQFDLAPEDLAIDLGPIGEIR